MANSSSDPIACMSIGSSLENPSCCYTNDQSDPICENLTNGSLLQNGCPSNDCISDCSDVKQIYASRLQQNLTGNGYLPIARYMACANVPSIASYADQGVLSPNINKSVQQYLIPNTSEDDLQTVTSAVTDCLSSTCRNSRNSSFCYDEFCSPVKLLQSNISPNVEEINTCLYTLCSHPVQVLPWADADVIGIGVGSFVLASNYEITNQNCFSGLLVVRHSKHIHRYTLARFPRLCDISAQKRRT